MKSENADKQQITMNKGDGVENGTTNNNNSTATPGRKKRSAEQSIKSE